MHDLYDLVVALSEQFWYLGIFIMMTVESSFIPFPSELAMIPAGINIAQWDMSLLLVFLAWTLWAILWASINYFGGMYLWKPVVTTLIHKYWKYIFLNTSHYDRSEAYFEKHGSITTLVWRFIPAVRQLISIPAGIFRMNYLKFLFYTMLWAGIWNGILILIWYIAGRNEELVKKMIWEAFLITLVVLWTIIFAYVYYVKSQAKKLRKLEAKIEKQEHKAAKEAKKNHKK